MSKYSSDSNSRDRTRSYSRYYNQRHRSSSSISTESSKHSKRYHSSRSGSRYHKKSKRRHRSNSSSDYSTSRHKSKNSSRSYRKDGSRSKKSHRNRRRSSTTSDNSNYSNSPHKYTHSKRSKMSNDSEKSKVSQPNSTTNCQADPLKVKFDTVMSKDQNINFVQKNIYDVMKRENTIEQINQEGFVFKVFKPLSMQKIEITDSSKSDVKLNDEIINNMPVEESTFLISNSDRLLSAKYKLLTKQERCHTWAKLLFTSYKRSENHNIKQKLQ